jgi:hypothetical protein
MLATLAESFRVSDNFMGPVVDEDLRREDNFGPLFALFTRI